jgi:predicted nucleic acid-binding protein
VSNASSITKTPMNPTPPKPRVFVDADVLFAGAASPSQHSASLVVLQLAEITLIEALTSRQVITEAERNLEAKLPQTLPTFRLLVSRSLQIVPDPQLGDLVAYKGAADAKDLSILVAALQAGCPWLVTFNVRHFQPGHAEITALRPGDFVQRVRELLTAL